jgi:hypothetical protein
VGRFPQGSTGRLILPNSRQYRADPIECAHSQTLASLRFCPPHGAAALLHDSSVRSIRLAR